MKTTKRILIAVILVVSIQHVAFSQESVIEPTKSPNSGIGVGAGFTTGYGLSYRYFPKKWGVQLNVGGFKEYEEKELSAGITFLYSIYKNKYFNFYLYEANSYFYSTESRYIFNFRPLDDSSVTIDHDNGITESVNNGVGMGFEVAIAQKVGINYMFGYASFDDFQRVNFTSEAAIYYKF